MATTLDHTLFASGTTSASNNYYSYNNVELYSSGSATVTDPVSGLDTLITATFSASGANDAYNWTNWYYFGEPATTGYDDNDSIASWSFSNPIESLEFTISDVDEDQLPTPVWDDRVILEIRDEDGSLVPAADVIAAVSSSQSHHTFTMLPDGTVQIDGGDDFGTGTSDDVSFDFSGTGIKISSIQVTFTGGDAHPGFGYLGISDFDFSVVCFTRGTKIKTPEGEKLIENLTVGDRVWTLDSGAQEIRWIGEKSFSPIDLAMQSKLRPIIVRKDALGKDMPTDDLYVSPQHRVLTNSKIARRVFGETEVLIAAKKLLSLTGIDTDDSASPVTYYHILFDRHELVWANGALAESLYVGEQALKAMTEEGREEILQLFPELFETTFLPARPIPNGRSVRALLECHNKNGHRLCCTNRVQNGFTVSDA